MENEILDIMAVLTLQEKLKTIRERRFFSIIADEGTDVSSKEQLSFCLLSVDKNLNAFEDFIGFYQLENIKSDTIVQVIKDILIRMNLSLSNCRGQTYDGSSNMMGKKSGVSTQILTEQPKAVAIHCQGHSLDHLLGNISDNIGKEDSETFKKLKKLSATRWTVHEECMKRVIDNYESLLQLWEECLEENLDQEAKVRIVGCKSQMESFYFFRHQSAVQAL